MPPTAITPVPGCRIACLLLALVCLDAASPAAAQSPTLPPRAGQEPITPIPAVPAQDPRRLALGERLFNDRRLSHDNTRSCSSCHDIRTNGASANAHDVTPEGQPLALNTPTVFNAALNFRLNWAGNFRSLESHAEQTLRNPAIMASSADEVVSKLRADPETVRQFRDAYGREPDVAALLDAIATYERSLVTPGSRFDRWLAGDADAITPEELVRLSAVQVAWLHLLPPRRQCGRQPLPATRHFPSNWLCGARIGTRPQPA